MCMCVYEHETEDVNLPSLRRSQYLLTAPSEVSPKEEEDRLRIHREAACQVSTMVPTQHILNGTFEDVRFSLM